MSAATPSERFFSSLPEIERFRDVVDDRLYVDVPNDWGIVITDVRGSTRAIEAGRYRDVNALGAAGIIALRNALPDVELPFVFGGDGATVLVPQSRREAVERTLCGLRHVASDAFDLELRVALVPVAELKAAGNAVSVARFRTSPHVALAMFMGDGFSTAEAWVKDELRGPTYAIPQLGVTEADLSGFECRWQPVDNRRGTMLSLLVQVLAVGERKVALYREVVDKLEALFDGEPPAPISVERMRLKGVLSDYSTEARLRSGEPRGERYRGWVAEARKRTLIGKALVITGKTAGGFDGAAYRAEFVQNCDFRKFDETLRMVLDVSDEQRERIEALLAAHRRRGELAYGMHYSPRALVTCYVRSYSGDHVHFVDGSDGGYAMAAKQLKAQLSA